VEYNNFNTAMALIAGLHFSSITRLKKTWRSVPQKWIECFEKVKMMMSHEGNYQHYRERLQKAKGIVTNPYLGLFLKDLTVRIALLFYFDISFSSLKLETPT
jgi:son of sevenless-like protein